MQSISRLGNGCLQGCTLAYGNIKANCFYVGASIRDAAFKVKDFVGFHFSQLFSRLSSASSMPNTTVDWKTGMTKLTKLESTMGVTSINSRVETVAAICKRQGTDRDHRLYENLEEVEHHCKRQLQAVANQAAKQSNQWIGREKALDHAIQKSTEDGVFQDTYPITLEETKKVGNFECATACVQGKRESMEDTHLAIEITVTLGEETIQVPFFGVFDGHGGKKCAEFVRDNIALYFQKQLGECHQKHNEGGKLSKVAIANALQQTFVKLSADYKKIQNSPYGNDRAGTTATVAMVIGNELFVGNVGDSRTILVDKDGTGWQLSKDAKPGDPDYDRGVVERGGQTQQGRVCPQIEGKNYPIGQYYNGMGVVRAIGDADYPAITARCKFVYLPMEKVLEGGAELILVCDGATDVASTADIAGFVSRSQGTVAEKAERLVKAALCSGTRDNVTAMVVKLPPQSMA